MSGIPTTSFEPSFFLASGSPRRQQLLREAGYCFRIVLPSVDESVRPFELPLAYVQRMAESKSIEGFKMNGCLGPTLGADTVIILDNAIIGKPKDYDDAVRILSLLSGRIHRVVTAFAFTNGYGSTASDMVTTEVAFRTLSSSQIKAYCAGGEPMDKAGAYSIQGGGREFVARCTGSFTNVIGLPMDETAMMLASYGIFPSGSGLAAGFGMGALF